MTGLENLHAKTMLVDKDGDFWYYDGVGGMYCMVEGGVAGGDQSQRTVEFAARWAPFTQLMAADWGIALTVACDERDAAERELIDCKKELTSVYDVLARLKSEIGKLRARIAELEARPNSLTVAARMASLEGKTLSGAGVVAAVLAGAPNSAEPALSTNLNFGCVEGDLCNRDGCEGTIVFNKRRNCSCHLGAAPCSGCELRSLVCDVCGAFPSEEDL